MAIYFTSDTHFGSQRTLELSKRPFTSVEEMDRVMIDNWNSVVGKDDIVYHLGDFGNYDIIKQLNGKVRLIYGNYETEDLKNRPSLLDELKELGFDCQYPFDDMYIQKCVIDVDGYEICMAHKPTSVIHENAKDKIHLFGHIHKLQMVKKRGLNVGVDCHNFTPIDLDTVLFYHNAIQKYYDKDVFCE